jgi:hypothetical protein
VDYNQHHVPLIPPHIMITTAMHAQHDSSCLHEISSSNPPVQTDIGSGSSRLSSDINFHSFLGEREEKFNCIPEGGKN